MKNKNQKKECQPFLIIGITFLIVGFIALARASNDEGLGVGYYFYAMFLFIIAFLRYNGEKEFLKEFLF